ncbi:MAG: hypothetical protein BA871_09550 [Desulfuromonadales bacterium C00003096]|nr:MAG: hypothetical protein BA871_09550 [Desulfuromonadales bacterium C00003096]
MSRLARKEKQFLADTARQETGQTTEIGHEGRGGRFALPASKAARAIVEPINSRPKSPCATD